MPSFYDAMCDALASGLPFALGLIASAKGSSPRKPGAKALFFADGRIVGTIGGGRLEAQVQERARAALATGQPATMEVVMDSDFGLPGGMICGGRVKALVLPRAAEAREFWLKLAGTRETLSWGVRQDFSIAWLDDSPEEQWLYRETISPPCALWIAGAGHVAQGVAPLARQLEFEVTVFDDRPELANEEHFPAGTRFRVGPWEQIVAETLPNRPTLGLVVTRGYLLDALTLQHWIHQPFVFLGMIGSQRKGRLVFEHLLEKGLATAEELARVACPVGLDILAESVPEIAVSIMAQLVQKRAERFYGVAPSGRGQAPAPLAGVGAARS
jgi:xanthine dehydrogenase accessory factor